LLLLLLLLPFETKTFFHSRGASDPWQDHLEQNEVNMMPKVATESTKNIS
jgi:hypothetical protein